MSASTLSKDAIKGLNETLRILGLPDGLDAYIGIDGQSIVGHSVINYISHVMASAINEGMFVAEIDIFNRQLRAVYKPALERLRGIKDSIAAEDISRIFLDVTQAAPISLNSKIVMGQIDKWARKDDTFGRLANWLTVHACEPPDVAIAMSFQADTFAPADGAR